MPDFFHLCSMFVSLHLFLVVDALMAATVVVILDVVPDTLPQSRHIVLLYLLCFSDRRSRMSVL